MSNPARHFSPRFVVDFEYTSSNLISLKRIIQLAVRGKHDGFKDILADSIQS